jgi:hypothetical protein
MRQLAESVRLAATAIAAAIAVPGALALLLADPSPPILRPTTSTPLSDAASYLTTNASTALLILALAALLQHLERFTRARSLLVGATDCLLLIALAPRLAEVGYALGTGGTASAAFFVHLPLEGSAIALVTGIYIHIRRRLPLSRRSQLLATATALALLFLAAGLEAYATPRWSAA